MNAAPKPVDPMAYSDLDMYQMTRLLDQTKSELYARKYAAFYGSLLCSLNFAWTADMPTAATDGINLYWNPYFFLQLPPATRITVLKHELMHPAKLHFVRQGTRNDKIWNYACDIKINNELTADGYSFEGIEWCWRDPSFPPDMPEEDIYDALVAQGTQPQGGAWSSIPMLPHPNNPHGAGQIDPNAPPLDGTDMFPAGPMSKDDMAKAVNAVVRAQQNANTIGAGQMPGDIEALITQFLTPIVPWERLLHRFMEELQDNGYTWRKPNRRFTEHYLPSHFEDEGALTHLAYFEDTSGSISDADAVRFNSEFKYVKETYQPKKMTLIQFDTIIQDERVYLDTDPFDQVVIKGRGGTSLEPVRQWIIDHRPTAAVVFSDLCCAPMEPLPYEIPIIWVCISNRKAQVPFGQVIHIK